MIEAYGTGYPIRYSQFGTAASPPGDGTRSGSPTRPRTRGCLMPATAVVLPATRSSSCRRLPSACCWQPVTARAARAARRRQRSAGSGSSNEQLANNMAASGYGWTGAAGDLPGRAVDRGERVQRPTPPTRHSDARRAYPQNISRLVGWLPAGQRHPPADRPGAWPTIARPYGNAVRRLGLRTIPRPELVLSPPRKEARSAVEQEPHHRAGDHRRRAVCDAPVFRPEDLARRWSSWRSAPTSPRSSSARRSPLSCPGSPRCSGAKPGWKRRNHMKITQPSRRRAGPSGTRLRLAVSLAARRGRRRHPRRLGRPAQPCRAGRGRGGPGAEGRARDGRVHSRVRGHLHRPDRGRRGVRDRHGADAPPQRPVCSAPVSPGGTAPPQPRVRAVVADDRHRHETGPRHWSAAPSSGPGSRSAPP